MSREGFYRILPLEGSLDIYSARENMSLLLNALAPDTELELDLSALEEIDCAGLQLLIMAKQEAHRIGCQLRLSNHCPILIEAFELSGLASFFGDPILIKPTSEQPT